MKSISIVATQMQLLNCVELLQSLGCEHNELLIIASSAERKRQILYIIDRLSFAPIFKKITVIEPKYKYSICNSLYFRKQIKKTISKYYSFDAFIICNYKDIYVRYSYYIIWKKTPNIKTYIIDDGMSILEILRRRNEELINKQASIEIGNRHFHMVFPVRHMKSCIAPKLFYFTNHQLDTIHPTDELLKNNHQYLQNIDLSEISIDDVLDICFIGQPLPQFGTLKKESYNKWIKKFIIENSNGKGTIRYIPHPVERIDDNLDDGLKREMKIMKLDLPIEIYALNFSSSVIVAGFYSAALYNVHKIRPDLKVVCINPFEGAALTPMLKQALDSTYSVLTSSGIEIYKTNNI